MLVKREFGEGSHMALVSITTFSNFKSTLRAINDAEKDKLRCNHCNGKRHIKDTCIEIHGYSDWILRKVKTNKGQNNKRPSEVKVANIIDDEPCVVIVATRKVDHIELGELLSK